MKRCLIMTLAGVVGLIGVVQQTVLSQEPEETEYSLGIVSRILSNQIVTTEYDYDSGEEAEVIYALTPKVKLENVKFLKDIAVGDEVWVEYLSQKGKKSVVSIEVQKPFEERYAHPEE